VGRRDRRRGKRRKRRRRKINVISERVISWNSVGNADGQRNRNYWFGRLLKLNICILYDSHSIHRNKYKRKVHKYSSKASYKNRLI
jgi:hypothetical protein